MLHFGYSSAGDGGLYEPTGTVSDVDVVDLFPCLKLNVRAPAVPHTPIEGCTAPVDEG